MAPRIRLNLAKPLPTITEAFEDILEDITITTKGFGNVYMNPESICQLARSSFPVLPESKYKVQEVDKLGMLHNSNKVINISETSKMVPMYTLPNMTSLEKKSFILDCLKTYSSSIVDPLEELRTEVQKIPHWKSHSCHENTDTECLKHHFHGARPFSVQENMLEKQDVVNFFPRLPSPRPLQRDDSCSEQRFLKNQGRMQTPTCRPNTKRNDLLRGNGKSVWLHPPTETPLGSKVVRSSQKGQMLKTATFPEGDQLKYIMCSQNRKREENNEEGHGRYFHTGQKATTFDWISEYQSAWKAAKVRACLLPAIAES
ncbi:uncharacterized protein LOC103277898 [Anolis carolinensis]|uniref:uncharacterized protein LOC103277898 n=1 Tax=Anolis carolinensis TaxID=28377 RepID=UPI000462D25C|nr:PREDICTED: uncharacterized protein LOC103277898 [Anolis carolinensis]|eukprot:XP_008103063.1 PREDICTED: uncharacterized protein LOC103277898 [Anolis carolinensis]